MAEFPAMPLFTDAYLADCDHLTDAEHGRYLMMLIQIWRAPGQRFPNDDAWLARKFRRSVDAVRDELRPLIQEFFESDGNWITHGRVRREWAYLLERRQKQAARSKSRWDKEKDRSRGNATPHMPEDARVHDPDDLKKSDPAKPLAENEEGASRGNAPTPTPTILKDKTPSPSETPPEAPRPFDIKAFVWGPVVKAAGGERKRSLVGRWVKEYGYGAIVEAHSAAAVESPVDYAGWVSGFLASHTPKPMNGTKPAKAGIDARDIVHSKVDPYGSKQRLTQ